MVKQSLTQNQTAHFDWLTQEVYQWNKVIIYCISYEILVLIEILINITKEKKKDFLSKDAPEKS